MNSTDDLANKLTNCIRSGAECWDVEDVVRAIKQLVRDEVRDEMADHIVDMHDSTEQH